MTHHNLLDQCSINNNLQRFNTIDQDMQVATRLSTNDYLRCLAFHQAQRVVLAIVQHDQASVRLGTTSKYAISYSDTYKLLPFTAAEIQSSPC